MGIFDFWKKKENKEYNNDLDKKIICISEMFKEINKKGKLPFYLNADVLNSLKTIAKVDKWYNEIDNETLENLYNICIQWQTFNQSKKTTTVAKSTQIHKAPEWEGTWEEYQKALEENKITEFTKVTIIEDEKNNPQGLTEWVSIDENGEIEEYLE